MKRLINKKGVNEHILFTTQLILIVFWGFQLLNSDAYYVNYSIILMLSVVCISKNRETGYSVFKRNPEKYAEVIINLFAILFSCMVALSNYKLWDFAALPEVYGYKFKWCYQHFMRIILLAGGFLAFKNIFIAVVHNIKNLIWSKRDSSVNYIIAFAGCFVLLIVTRLIILFGCQYPGELTPDSITQISEIYYSGFSNHHPFYHTMVIKLFISIGMNLFNDINAAVATYSVFQIISTSLIFSFAVSTMARIKAPKWMVIVSILFFVLMPYHITFAITMWKDVLFGCFVLLLATSICRCMHEVGPVVLNYITLAVSSVGICLFRSNGFFAFVVLTMSYIILWKAKNKRILIVLVSAIIISFFMKHPVLAYLNVPQPDTIESLSVPAQQIARVVQEGCYLDEWQRELLSKVIDIEQIPEQYSPYISDPIKWLVRYTGNQKILVEQKIDYIKLYFSLGIRYPLVYLRAWIDLTRGYWNAGYEYWRWSTEITANDYGIVRTTNNFSLDLMFKEYLWLFTNFQILRLFISIGLFVWIDIIMLMIALLRKDKVGVFISLPILTVVASLLVATPVFSELRYNYAAFCTLPLVIVVVLRPISENNKDSNN